MIFFANVNNRTYEIDVEKPLDISIPLNFGGGQPNAYGVEKASSKACEAGSLIGDTRRGGSCNFEQIKLIPHCNGTHTESVGHITYERISIRDCLRDAFVPATLVSIEPENASKTYEKYAVELNENELLITAKAIEKALSNENQKNEISVDEFLRGLIVRVRPNDESKLTRQYLEDIPPFFSTEAMKFLVEIGVKHLLVDLPSIDRIYDEGKLSNHRIFWNVEQGSFETDEKSSIYNTVTELIYVPNEIEDGKYLLNLQISPFASDASPSRPILFKVCESNQE